MSRNLRVLVIEMYHKGLTTGEIARELDITEFEVCKIVGKNY